MKDLRYYILIGLLSLLAMSSCKKYLDETPQGVISSADLTSVANTEDMVTAAYSKLGNDYWVYPYASMWAFGDVRGGDSYKGGGGAGDVAEINEMELFSINNVYNDSGDGAWSQLYVGVARCNTALQLVEGQSLAAYPQKIQREAELRFLRGHFYFLLKILFDHIPWIDETLQKSQQSYATVSNVALTSSQLWTNIENDFKFAAANLPLTQTQVGRATKGAAQAYLAKAELYHAYTQDDKNNVTGTDQALLAQVNSNCDSVISSGKYALNPDYGDNFLSQFDNSAESVFSIQYSQNDGTQFGRVDYSHILDGPMAPQYGCCGFHVPSDNLVNAFKTDVNGLPMFTAYNNSDVVPSGDYKTNSFDPRLDHTAAIPGHPFKYTPTYLYQAAWARDQATYGPLLNLKEQVIYTDPAFLHASGFPTTSKNWAIIRYSDVLLMKAEALIKMNQEQDALPLINMVRARAANSTGMLKQADGTPTSNYHIDIYKPGVNCTWTNDYAWQALMFERRMEFAMEGYHFFDLVRWGIADTFINSYFATEQKRTTHLAGAAFTKNRDEYLPISQNQMTLSKGVYKQNPGW